MPYPIIFQTQWEICDGKCGICGDPYNANVKDHEAPGGQWGNTQITTGDYEPGEWIDVSIEVNSIS